MIVVLTSRGHEYTLRSLENGTFGFPTPKLICRNYEWAWRARRLPRATYLFTDFERLSAEELRFASELYRVLKDAGMRCLNDPARTMLRVELLQNLHAAGINPFTCYRADERPAPARFPVFLRSESDHSTPSAELLNDQSELDAALERLRAEGISPRGMLVIEQCAEPYAEGFWAKWGVFRVGDDYSVDHIGVEEIWMVKTGTRKKLTEAGIADEHDAVKTNRFADGVKPAFELAEIEFGRADISVVAGRPVIYEINTNPYLAHYVADPDPLRRDTQAICKTRFARMLEAIDTIASGRFAVETTELLKPWRESRRLGWLTPRRA